MVNTFEPAWRGVVSSDTTTSSSDKTLTVPSRYLWEILNIRVDYTTNATAGARQLEIRFLDKSGTVFYEYVPAITQTASTQYTYNIGPMNIELASVRDSRYLFSKIAPILLEPSWSIRVLDNNAVAPSGSGENLLIYVYALQRKFLL